MFVYEYQFKGASIVNVYVLFLLKLVLKIFVKGCLENYSLAVDYYYFFQLFWVIAFQLFFCNSVCILNLLQNLKAAYILKSGTSAKKDCSDQRPCKLKSKYDDF